MEKLDKKGQLSIGDAPKVVLIVGLIFLLMATIAFIGEKYGDSIENIDSATVTNESGAYINSTGYTLANAGAYSFANPVIVSAYNNTDNIIILSGNYSISSTGVLTNATTTTWADVNVTYTYNWYDRSSAFNATIGLQTEISDNVSIAGIVLTISLVVFVGFRTRRI